MVTLSGEYCCSARKTTKTTNGNTYGRLGQRVCSEVGNGFVGELSYLGEQFPDLGLLSFAWFVPQRGLQFFPGRGTVAFLIKGHGQMQMESRIIRLLAYQVA